MSILVVMQDGGNVPSYHVFDSLEHAVEVVKFDDEQKEQFLSEGYAEDEGGDRWEVIDDNEDCRFHTITIEVHDKEDEKKTKLVSHYLEPREEEK